MFFQEAPRASLAYDARGGLRQPSVARRQRGGLCLRAGSHQVPVRQFACRPAGGPWPRCWRQATTAACPECLTTLRPFRSEARPAYPHMLQEAPTRGLQVILLDCDSGLNLRRIENGGAAVWFGRGWIDAVAPRRQFKIWPGRRRNANIAPLVVEARRRRGSTAPASIVFSPTISPGSGSLSGWAITEYGATGASSICRNGKRCRWRSCSRP